MYNFVALDVETATGKRSSICQIGLAIVEDGQLIDTVSILVRPPYNEYNYWNIKIHGIEPPDTRNEPEFPEVWQKIYPLIKGKRLVAHNAPFDKGCLEHSLRFYNMEVPRFDFACTYRMTKQKLNLACETYGVQLLNHHDACADAKACAELFLKVQKPNLGLFG